MLAARRTIPELDALRGFAAVYVFLHHVQLLRGTALAPLLAFGQESVILFFLLSGFVIQYSTARSAPSVRTYLAHRLRRIYPTFLAAMLVAYLVHSLVRGQFMEARLPSLFGNLLMLQDDGRLKQGAWVLPYYGNTPAWSLSYEWWFYLAFIPLGLLPSGNAAATRWRRVVAITVAGILTYQWKPNPASLFAGYLMIWWAGAELAAEYLRTGSVSFRGQASTLAGLAVCTLLWAWPVFELWRAHGPVRVGAEPALQMRHYLAAVAFVLAGLCWRRLDFQGFRWLFAPFIPLAAISYSLYLFHYPVLSGWRIISPDSSPLEDLLVGTAVVLPLSILVEVLLPRWLRERKRGAAGNRIPAAPVG